MAESYRGLTIRIGGDTTKLQKALVTANRTVSDTESALRKLNQAVKLDPTSISAVNMQMGAMADRATAAAYKLAGLKTAMKQMESMEIDGKPITEVAQETRNVQAAMEGARTAMAKASASLGTMHDVVTKLASDSAKIKTSELAKDWTANWKLDGTAESVNKIIDELGKLPPYLSVSDKLMAGFTDKVVEMQNAYAGLSKQAESYAALIEKSDSESDKLALQKKLEGVRGEMKSLEGDFTSLVERFAKFGVKGTVFNFDNANTDVKTLRAALEAMPESVRPGQAAIDNFISEVSRLQEELKNATTDFDKARLLAELKDLGAEMELTTAKAKNLAAAMANMKLPSSAMQGMADLRANVEVLDSSVKQTVSHADQMAKAYASAADKTDPSAIAALKEAMSGYVSGLRQVNEEMERQQELIDGFDATAIYEAADMTKSAQQQLFEASNALAEAQNKHSIEEGKWEHEKELVEQLTTAVSELTVQEMQQGEVSEEAKKKAAKNDEENQKALAEHQRLMAEYRARADELAEAEREASEAFDFARQRKELEDARATMAGLRAEADTIVSKYHKVENIELVPKIDDSVTKALEDLGKSADSVAQFSLGIESSVGELEALGQASKNAMDHLKEVDALVKANPGDKNLRAQWTEAYADAIKKSRTYQSELNKVISSIPLSKIDQAALKEGTFGAKLAASKQKFDQNTTAAKGLEDSIKKLEKERDQLKSGLITDATQRRIDELNGKIAELRKELNDVANTGRSTFEDIVTESATKEVDELLRKLESVDVTLAKLGNAKPGELTPKFDDSAFVKSFEMMAQVARRAANEIVTSANEIDSAYRDMRKTVNGTEDEFQSLYDSAVKYSQTHITSADTMLEMQALGGQLGIVVDDLEQFGRIASNLDISTDIGAEDIALKLGQVANILDLDIDGMQGFGDALVRLGNNMPAQESSIMAVAQRFAAVASTANFSGDQILAWSAAIASTGQRSEAAATAIGNTVSGIEQAIAEGGSDLKQFAAIAQMSAEQFTETWKSDPTEALRAFILGLRTLRDSDESAVATLENMGITGVRQQQTLLGLTNTIENLDKALTISKDAWNGISDEWGQAGDAAIEAGRKSEGFSGSLAILKNNIQDLAASMGDGLVPIMNAASDVIRVLTDLLNQIPAPVKTAAFTIGGLATAIPALSKVVDIFSKGWGQAAAALEASGGNVVALITNLLGLTTAADGAAAAGTGLAGVFTGPVVLGLAAAAVAIGAVATAVMDVVEKQQTYQQATSELASSIGGMQTAYDEYSEASQNSVANLSDFIDKTDEAIQKQAELAGLLKGEWEEVGSKKAQVDTYARRIEELATAAGRTKAQQAELNKLIAGFNDLTGASISLSDKRLGKLNELSDQVSQYADVWKRQIENEEGQDMYNQTLAKRVDIESQLYEAQDRLTEAQKRAKEATTEAGRAMAMQDVAGYRDEVNRLSAALAENDRALEASMQFTPELAKAWDDLKIMLEATGDSMANYSDLTKDEWVEVLSAYQVSVPEAIKMLQQLQAAHSDAAAKIAADLEEQSKKARNAAYKTAKAEADAAYTARKNELNAEYKQMQRGFNNDYKQLQRALNNEYKHKQKAYDKDYKALQKQLQSQYDARKKAYDKQLKALKDSQSKEVDAFKKATDSKLKEMEREYNAAVKLLEAEYGGKTDDIDERIKALNEQTEAEKAAIEERERADKIAELEDAVRKAKSRRTRAEAEKALNDYLQDLQAERNEESRKAEIERLEEQKDALKEELTTRKEALKEQYDNEVQTYKDSRATMLEAIQEANQVEYDTLKEKLDSQLEALKEAQSLQLESLKEAQTAELEALRESQQDQLDALKESQQQKLDAKKAENDQELADLKAKQKEELEAIKKGETDKTQAEAEGQTARRTMADRHLTTMEKRMQESGDRRIRTAQESGDRVNYETDKRLSVMEKRMQDAGDRNVGIAKNAGDTLNRTTEDSLSEMDRKYSSHGASASRGLKDSLDQGRPELKTTADMLAAAAGDPIEALRGQTFTWGYDFTRNFNNGMAEPGLVNTIRTNAMNIANSLFTLFHHSTPDEGPLKHDDKWGGEFVQNLIDGMQDKERDLARQVERMARLVEDGFDPTLSVAAANEAISTINSSRSRGMTQAVASAGVGAGNMTVNVNLSGVSIRSEADIERLATEISRQMAAQAKRQRAGRL